MLSLTRKADYAIVAMAELALAGSRMSVREVAKRTEVPMPVLTNIFYRLLQDGLVTSTMGVKGGYSLARPAERITLAEVIEAIEGPIRLALCCGAEESKKHRCKLEPNCQVRKSVRLVHDSLREFLSQITLAHLAFGQTPVMLLTVRRRRQ